MEAGDTKADMSASEELRRKRMTPSGSEPMPILWENVRATFIERLGEANGGVIADGVIAAFKGDASVRGTALAAVVAGVPERLVAEVGALITEVRNLVLLVG